MENFITDAEKEFREQFGYTTDNPLLFQALVSFLTTKLQQAYERGKRDGKDEFFRDVHRRG